MRDYAVELERRVAFIQDVLKTSGAKGIVFGNSGGKDSALVGILCKKACDNTVGIMMPCESKRNFGIDMDDGGEVAKQFGIENRTVDITETKQTLVKALSQVTELNQQALTNINPRLRMATVYAVAAAEGRLVAGTGNRSEAYMGYFTKWGDGAHDFNPIADLTVGEIYEHLRALKAPSTIIEKAPSAGLYQGQTDESELGIKYADVDKYLRGEQIPEEVKEKIEKAKTRALHKACMPRKYPD